MQSIRNLFKFKTNFLSRIFKGRVKSTCCAGYKNYICLMFLGIVFISSMFLTTGILASEVKDTANFEKLDKRLLPWIGSWRLVSNKVNKNESPSKTDYFLTISPGNDGKSIAMKGYRDDKILLEEEIIVDGQKHTLKDEKCTGYYLYSWSENGKRLLFNSESNCPGDPPRRISGMSIIDENSNWLDIQLLKNGVEKAISIRRYRSIDSDSVTSMRFNPSQITSSRIAAGKNLSISEIIELSSKVESEVIEAALLEIRKPFPINSKQLVKLSDSGVNSRIVDLMVALSFPEKFSVKPKAISLVKRPEPYNNYPYFRMPYRYYPYDYPFLPWHWTSSTYMTYGYSYLGWYIADGYYYPFWSSQPVYVGGGGSGAVRDSGALIRGQGYTRVAPGSTGSSTRHAQPRSAPIVQSTPIQSSSSSSSGTSSSYSGGSSGGSASTSSSGVSPSASPNGYSSGR